MPQHVQRGRVSPIPFDANAPADDDDEDFELVLADAMHSSEPESADEPSALPRLAEIPESDRPSDGLDPDLRPHITEDVPMDTELLQSVDDEIRMMMLE